MSSRYCIHCEGHRIFQQPKVNHVLHLILSICTAGFWAIMWFLLAFCSSVSKETCTVCGQTAKVPR